MTKGLSELAMKGAKATLLSHTRAAARSLAKGVLTSQTRAEVCLDFLSKSGQHSHDAFRRALHSLPDDERHYWIGTLYTLLLPINVRRSQATYFTPPTVADAVVDLAIDAGFNLATDTVLDPAAGGAAFLSTLAGRMVIAGLPAKEVSYRLNGIEIDAGLAVLSSSLIAERLRSPLSREVIITGDALRVTIPSSYGLVIANPPYGRVGVDEIHGEEWRKIAHSGHVNKYALFAELCLRHTRPGGIVALVIPSSFRTGPLYDRMRAFIRSEAEVIAVGSIPGRDDVFIDVAQDISVLIARKGRAHDPSALVRFPVVGAMPSSVPVANQTLPVEPNKAWPLPTLDSTLVGGSTLSEYGVKVRAGYFVWNRQRERLVKKLHGRGPCYPLVWAKNVRPGTLCRPAGKRNAGTDFVTFSKESTAIVSGVAAIMQRTTNDMQPRRLIASMVDPEVTAKWGGFVSENHTIVLTGDDPVRLEMAVRLLNTAVVDQRYRRVSGTASVSVTLLRQIDLPSPAAFAAALAKNDDDDEAAATEAYQFVPESVYA
jgi:adenine-specific DNA-methyltransferase